MNFSYHLKGLSKDAVVYGLGNALGKLIAIVTAPILTMIFSPEDFGVLALMQTTTAFLVMLVSLNLNSGTYRYYFEYDEPLKKNRIVSTSFFFYLGTGICLAAILYLFAPAINSWLLFKKLPGQKIIYPYISYLRIISIGVVFSIMDTNFRSLLRMNRQPFKYMVLNILQVVTNLMLIVILVVYCRQGIEGALWAGVITNVIVCCVGFFLVFDNLVLDFSFAFLGMFLAYCLPQFPSVIINWGLMQSNRFFINYYSPLIDQGYYAIGIRVASVFLLFSTAFRLAWDPFSLSVMKQADAKTIYGQTFSFYMTFFCLISAGLALLAKPILILLTPSNYWNSYSIVVILIWSFLYMGGNNILGIGIGISKRTKFISYAQLFTLIVNLSLNFILIPKWGAWGAAWAFLGGALTQSISYYYFAQRLYPVDFKFFRLNLLGSIVFIILLIETHLITNYNFWESLITGLLFFPLIVCIIIKVGLTRDQQAKSKTIVFDYIRGL